MKKNLFLVTFLFSFFAVLPLFAKESEVKADTYEYDLTLSEIKEIGSPYISNGYIVFTAPINANSLGIAFDFEGFRKIHYFKIRKNYGYEGDVTSSFYFYITEVPKKLSKICYRVIIDGLWTTDPQNKNVLYNNEENYALSYINLPPAEIEITEKLSNGMTHFVCHTESGKKIRLGGSFTNWDSWIYELKETEPGKYEIDIPLHPGTYYYSYYSGITAFLDETNPSHGYSADGRIVSCITIN